MALPEQGTTMRAEQRWLLSALFSALVGICCPALAEPPVIIPYQGYLTDSAGQPLNGLVSVTFALYTAASGGTPTWTDSETLTVSAGVFSYNLGSNANYHLHSSILNDPLYLGVQVNSDPEMTPRLRVGSDPFARISGGLVCRTEQTLCPVTGGQLCVNETEDPSHCGGCGNKCVLGASCTTSVCVCPAGDVSCPTGCANLSNDPNHCGNCTNVCAAGHACISGVCT
jgi:hypothetical protein